MINTWEGSLVVLILGITILFLLGVALSNYLGSTLGAI